MDYRRTSCIPSLFLKSKSSAQDHWQDVTVGSILGLTVAYFAYRQYYPGLADELSHRPYSPRIKDENSGPILPVHDSSQSQGHDTAGADRRYDSFELEGTVQRPGQQHLRDPWKGYDDPSAEGSGTDHRLLGGSDANR